MSKKGKKKGVHTVPEENRMVKRRREQERKALEKKSKILMRQQKNKRKKNKMAAPSESEDTGNQQLSQDETRGAEKVLEEDIDSPHSSYTEPSTSRTSGHQECEKKFSSKVKKNADSSTSFGKKPIESNVEPTSSTTGQQVNDKNCGGKRKKNTNLPDKSSNKLNSSSTKEQRVNQSDSNKRRKNTDLPNKPSNKPSTSSTTEQRVNQSDSNKGKKANLPNKSSNKSSTSSTTEQQASQKPGNIHAPPKGKSVSKPKSSDLKIPKNITEGKKSAGNIAVSGVDNPSKDSVHKKLPKSDQDKMLKDENKKVVGKKPTESKDLVSSTSNTVTPLVHSKSTGDSTGKRNILEQKLKASKAEMKSSDEQVKRLSLVKNEEIAVIGDIKLRSKEQSDIISVNISDEKGAQNATYDQFTRMAFLEDMNIKLSIKVNQGNRIICNVRNRQETDLVQNVATGSDTVEGNVLENPYEKSKTEKVEKYDKTTSEAKWDSKTLGEFSNAFYPTMGNQAADNSGEDTLKDSEICNETTTETKGISRQEKIEEICESYLKHFNLVLENFSMRFKKYLRDRSLKRPDM